MFHSDETPKSENYFTLKVSPRPVKHYKIVSFEEEKLCDYDAIIDKLKQMARRNYFYILFLKRNQMDEVAIYNKADWNDYYYNNIIQAFIDNRKILKIEFDALKEVPKLSDKDMKRINEDKLRVIMKYNSNQWFLNSMIGLLESNEVIQKEIKKHFIKELFSNNNTTNSMIDNKKINQNNLRRSSNVEINTELLSSIVIDKFERIKNKIDACQEIESTMKNSKSDAEDELKMEMSLVKTTDNGKAELIEELPPFASYYADNIRSTFHEKFMRETIEIDQP